MSVADEQFKKGLEAYEAGSYAEALGLFENVLEMEPYSAETWLNLGNVHYQNNSLADAAECWLKTISYDPMQDKAYLNLGNLYYKQHHFQNALYYWDIFKGLRPKYAEVYLNMGLAYEAIGALKPAFQAYADFMMFKGFTMDTCSLKTRMQETEKAAAHNYRQARMALKQGFTERARVAFELCVAQHPMESTVYKEYATLLLELKYYPESAQQFERALVGNPSDKAVLVNLGALYDKLNKPFETLWAYAMALFYDQSGCLPEKVKKYYDTIWSDKGVSVIETAVETVRAHIKAGEYRQAEALAQQIMDIARYQKLEDTKIAVQGVLTFLKARKNPHQLAGEMAYVLAEDFKDKGEYDKALRFYDRYLQVYPQGERCKEVTLRKEEMQKVMATVINSVITSEISLLNLSQAS